MNQIQTDIAISGGGPVGLYLAGRLLQHGVSCKVLEKKKTVDMHSKSLGIHPVSLDLFDNAGITVPFLEEGVKIRKGFAFWNRKKMGEIQFGYCPEPHTYILALPQWQTEKILQKWVCSLDKNAVIRGADVTRFSEKNDSMEIRFRLGGKLRSLTSKYLVGCDGKNSFVRTTLAIPYEGKQYPDYYIMGDFTDNTAFGPDAAVYLHKDGLVESFPLPGRLRRWVVKTAVFPENPKPDLLAEIVSLRTGHSLAKIPNRMMSRFGVQHFLARTFHSGRVLLAGDAAHVVSPIGGQGMNLGWLGAEHCFNCLMETVSDPKKRTKRFEAYTESHKKIARQVARRAEINMHLGRKETSTRLYKILLTVMIKTPFSRILPKLFTMRGLGRWPI